MQYDTLALKMGANIWAQYTEWGPLHEAGIRADQLGFDSLWTRDHLYPIVGSHEGPNVRGLAHARSVGGEARAAASVPYPRLSWTCTTSLLSARIERDGPLSPREAAAIRTGCGRSAESCVFHP